MKRNAFGQLSLDRHPFLRFTGDGGEGGKEFKAPESQEELDRIITDRTSRAERKAREEERAKFADYDELRADAEKFRASNKPAPKTDDGKPEGVSQEDVDKRINDALAAKDLELAQERVSDKLDKALEGRTFSASLLLNLDRKQFVKDGKTVDTDAIKEWVEKNSKESEAPDPRRRRIPGQGDRDVTTSGGSVSAGRDLFEDQKKKKPATRKD